MLRLGLQRLGKLGCLALAGLAGTTGVALAEGAGARPAGPEQPAGPERPPQDRATTAIAEAEAKVKQHLAQHQDQLGKLGRGYFLKEARPVQGHVEKLSAEEFEEAKRSILDCESRSRKALQSRRVQFLLHQLGTVGCPVPSPSSFIKCAPCSLPIGGAIVRDETTARMHLVACQDVPITQDEFVDVIVHELVHMYDLCRANIKDTCDEIACMEVRASHLSGECEYFKEFNRGRVSLIFPGHMIKCVRRRALNSILFNPACKSPEEVRASGGGERAERARVSVCVARCPSNVNTHEPDLPCSLPSLPRSARRRSTGCGAGATTIRRPSTLCPRATRVGNDAWGVYDGWRQCAVQNTIHGSQTGGARVGGLKKARVPPPQMTPTLLLRQRRTRHRQRPGRAPGQVAAAAGRWS